MKTIGTLNHIPQPANNAKLEEWSVYFDRVLTTVKAYEKHQINAVLIFASEAVFDQWALAQFICANTTTLIPLIAVRPTNSHPTEIYRRIIALNILFNRPIWINLVAGANRDELFSLGDKTDHDLRYEKLEELYVALKEIFATDSAITYDGKHYNLKDYRPFPILKPPQNNIFFLSGSSDKAIDVARKNDLPRIFSPSEKVNFCEKLKTSKLGFAIGIVTRKSEHDAEKLAFSVFPKENLLVDAKPAVIEDSSWRTELNFPSSRSVRPGDIWLEPFQLKRIHREGRRSNHPWIFGSYDTIRDTLKDLGVSDDNYLVLYIDNIKELPHITHIL